MEYKIVCVFCSKEEIISKERYEQTKGYKRHGNEIWIKCEECIENRVKQLTKEWQRFG